MGRERLRLLLTKRKAKCKNLAKKEIVTPATRTVPPSPANTKPNNVKRNETSINNATNIKRNETSTNNDKNENNAKRTDNSKKSINGKAKKHDNSNNVKIN